MPRRKKPVFDNAGDRIIMDISIAEARTLMVLLDRCGGDPDKSPRKYIDSLGSALQAAGIEPPSQEKNDWCEGDLSFRSGDIEKYWPKNPDYKGFGYRERRGNVLVLPWKGPMPVLPYSDPDKAKKENEWWSEVLEYTRKR